MLKIEVRNSQPSDRDAILTFLDTHKTARYPEHSRDDIVEQVENRKFFTITEHRGTDSRMIGVSGLFPFGGTPMGPEAPWRELGATRVILNGFGLHRVAIAVRVVHELALSPGADVLFVVLGENNVEATANHIASGFVPWTPPPGLAQAWADCCGIAPSAVGGDGIEGYQFLSLPSSAVAQLAYFVLRWDTPDAMLIRPASQRYGAAEAAQLVLSLDCLRSHRDQVNLLSQVELMTGRFGNGSTVRA